MSNRPRGAHAAGRVEAAYAGPTHARRADHSAPLLGTTAVRRAAVAVVAATAAPVVCAVAAQAAVLPVQSAMHASSADLAGLTVPVRMAQAVSPLTNGALAAGAADDLTSGAQSTVDRLTATLPLQAIGSEFSTAPNGSTQLAPDLLSSGALGTFSQNLSPQTQDLTGALDVQTAPLVHQLRQGGVPTVSQVTGGLATSPLPGFGTVGNLTGSLPVTTMLGSDSAVSSAINNLSVL